MALKKNPRFDLKLKYRRTLEVSYILTICLLLLAFQWSPLHEIPKYVPDPQEIITSTNLPPAIVNLLPPPPKQPVPVQTTDLDDPGYLPDLELIPNADIPQPPDLPDFKDDTPEETPPFEYVEDMPRMIGGIQSMYDNLIYPQFAIRSGIEGKVLLEAVIDESGNVINLNVIKGIGGGCDEAAMSALSKTKFIPGKQRGKTVKVHITLPVKFVLKN